MNVAPFILAAALAGVPATAHARQMDHSNHAGHDHAGEAHASHDHASGDMDMAERAGKAALTRTSQIDAALADGGEPVVVDVLGVVCDFCAKAMNKTFGKRAEVAAVYVDLDTKTLNLVMNTGQTLSDTQIDRLVEKAGYKFAAIRRGADALGAGR